MWHGANWTFIAWALYHALLFMPLLLLGVKKRHAQPIGKFSPMDLINILITFVLVTIGWIIFRAESLGKAWLYFKDIVHPKAATDIMATHPEAITTIVFIVILLVVEWLQKHHLHGLYFTGARFPKMARFVIYTVIIIFLVWFGGKPKEFIYFQF
jgi:hypothetical protein